MHERRRSDRATFHVGTNASSNMHPMHVCTCASSCVWHVYTQVGTNVSSGGCNGLPTAGAWLRVFCDGHAIPGLPACKLTVRATLYPVRVPVGYDAPPASRLYLTRISAVSRQGRATLYPVHIPVGYDATLTIPLEPGAADAASRALMLVDLGEVRPPAPPLMAC